MKLILIIIAFVAFFIALKKWQRAQAVKSGDPDAMANEGLRLIGRNSVDEGIALLEQAANKDHPAAAQMLYEFYTRPELEMVPNDADKAMHWAAKASSLDNEFAKLHDLMLELNQHPAFGDNIQLLEQNLLPRAEAGDIESQSQLGRVYARNPILDKDGSKAIKWLELAAAKDDPEACFHLGKLLQEPRQGEADMQQARFWLTKGHQLGETASGGHLAEMMLQGQGGPVDKRQAERLLIEQAKDSSYSQLTLGQRYLSGDHYPKICTRPENGWKRPQPTKKTAWRPLFGPASYSNTPTTVRIICVPRQYLNPWRKLGIWVPTFSSANSINKGWASIANCRWH